MMLKMKYLVLLTQLLILLLLLLKIKCLVLVIQSKKTDDNPEIKDIKNKCFTTFDYNKFPNNTLNGKITATKLVNQSGLNKMVKPLTKEAEIKKLATKAELKAEQDKIVKLQTYDLSLFY